MSGLYSSSCRFAAGFGGVQRSVVIFQGGVALVEEVVAVFQLKDARDAGKVNPGGDKLADAL